MEKAIHLFLLFFLNSEVIRYLTDTAQNHMYICFCIHMHRVKRKVCPLRAGPLATISCGNSSTQAQTQSLFSLGHRSGQKSDVTGGGFIVL